MTRFAAGSTGEEGEESTGRLAARSRSEVVLVDEEVHLPQLADFIRQVWSPELRLEDLREARSAAAESNPANPGQAPPTFLFLLEGTAVGHLTTIPTRLRSSDWSGPAHWLKGFWVLPEHRNGPIGAMLMREASRHLDCLLATVVDEAPRRVFGAFKMRDVGCFSEHIKLLRPQRVLQRLGSDGFGFGSNPMLRGARVVASWPGISALGGAMIGAAFAARSVGSGGARGLVAKLDSPDDAGLDAVWEEVASERSCSPIRDAAYFRRVYGGLPNPLYRILSLERDGRLVGWASLRVPRDGEGDPRLGGIRVATLCDLVVPARRTEVALALLREAESVAHGLSADALLCSATHPSLRGWLSRRSFVSVAGSLHLCARGPKQGPALPDSLDGWWLTRADGGADDGL